MMSLYLKTDRQSPVPIVRKKGVRLWEGKGNGKRQQQPHRMSMKIL